MLIDLRIDEIAELRIDDSTIFMVWGERNDEGTLIIKSEMKHEN
ncbi:hypothetical protein LCGC14_2229260 [marine sediment metagenome]|uniref:Uncharacterized protein n=1 Tax=marine sediment metagenome TaxID=412755 RepID=A0A0F9FLA1_9ZZZZ